MWPPIPTVGLMLVVFLICLAVLLIFRIINLEKQLDLNIEVNGPFVWTEPKDAIKKNEKAFRTYRLKITNTSSALVQNCQIKLIEMFNINNKPTREDGMAFKLKTDNPQDLLNTPYIQKFDIAPGGHEDIDIIKFDERHAKPTHIVMCYALKGHSDHNVGNAVPVAVCPHTMLVRVTAANCPRSIEKRLKFWVEDGFLRMEEIA